MCSKTVVPNEKRHPAFAAFWRQHVRDLDEAV
jgi:hypothetical protein